MNENVNLWGVYRAPQVNGRVRIYDTGTVNEDITVGSDETSTTTLNPVERVVGIYVSIYRNPSGGIPSGNLIGGKFTAFINETPIAAYALPNTNEWANGITEYVPANIELWGSGNTLKIVTGSDALGTSYNIFYRVYVYTVPL